MLGLGDIDKKKTQNMSKNTCKQIRFVKNHELFAVDPDFKYVGK